MLQGDRTPVRWRLWRRLGCGLSCVLSLAFVLALALEVRAILWLVDGRGEIALLGFLTVPMWAWPYLVVRESLRDHRLARRGRLVEGRILAVTVREVEDGCAFSLTYEVEGQRKTVTGVRFPEDEGTLPAEGMPVTVLYADPGTFRLL